MKCIIHSIVIIVILTIISVSAAVIPPPQSINTLTFNITTSTNNGSINGLRIIDGDTFVINNSKIRLFGIDTPELNQFYGNQSKIILQELFNRYNYTRQLLQCNVIDLDQYNRICAICSLSIPYQTHKLVLNSELVLLGAGIDYIHHSGGLYSKYELIAKSNRNGLWNYPQHYIEPYLWRKQQKQQYKSTNTNNNKRTKHSNKSPNNKNPYSKESILKRQKLNTDRRRLRSSRSKFGKRRGIS